VEDFVGQASAQILTLMKGNGGGAAVGVAKKIWLPCCLLFLNPVSFRNWIIRPGLTAGSRLMQ
jgi:hypothetical protein